MWKKLCGLEFGSGLKKSKLTRLESVDIVSEPDPSRLIKFNYKSESEVNQKYFNQDVTALDFRP